METTAKSKSFLSKLLDGEDVVCDVCGKGIYRPFNPEAKINHYFTCDYCGLIYHWDPVVEIK